jgi:hypothetical protein
MKSIIRPCVFATLLMGWAALVGLGAIRLWKYEGAAGTPARAPHGWPADTRVARAADLPTLVLLVHPHCPCSRATIGELTELMTHCHGKLVATVLMLHPAGMSNAWVHTDLWSSAAAIPGVTVLDDSEGVEAVRFGAATSGQSLLYSTDGTLLFAGGITESRGHSGDNAGRSAIESLVLGPDMPVASGPAVTPVYGCPLFAPGDCQKVGSTSCPR